MTTKVAPARDPGGRSNIACMSTQDMRREGVLAVAEMRAMLWRALARADAADRVRGGEAA